MVVRKLAWSVTGGECRDDWPRERLPRVDSHVEHVFARERERGRGLCEVRLRAVASSQSVLRRVWRPCFTLNMKGEGDGSGGRETAQNVEDGLEEIRPTPSVTRQLSLRAGVYPPRQLPAAYTHTLSYMYAYLYTYT